MKRNLNGLASVITGAMLMLNPAKGMSQANDQLREILTAAHRNAVDPQVIRFSATSTLRLEFEGEEPQVVWTETSARVQGTRMELENRTTHESPSEEGPNAAAAFVQRASWDGERYYSTQYHGGPGEPLRTVSDSAGAGRTVLASPKAGSFLEGKLTVLPPHPPEGSLFGWLLQRNDARLEPSAEAVGGHPCWVIKAETEHGSFAVWVDPNYGYRLRRVSATRRIGDGPGGVGWTRLSVDDVRIEKVGEDFFSTFGILVIERVSADGKRKVETIGVLREGVTAENAPSAELGFLPAWDDGARVFHVEKARYMVWRDGALEAEVSDAGVKRIEETVTALEEEARQGSPRLVEALHKRAN